jgi:NitT/TauT family transport system permease protein
LTDQQATVRDGALEEPVVEGAAIEPILTADPPEVPEQRPVGPVITEKPPPSFGKRVLQRLAPKKNRAILAVLGFFVVWQLVADYIVDDKLFLSGPVDVIQAIGDMWSAGTLQSDLLVSGKEFIVGLVAGVLFGIFLGLLLGTSDRAKGYGDPLLNGFYATPIIALAPLFILWFGISETKTIVLVFLLVFLPVTINTDVGIRATDPNLIEAARSFGSSKVQLFTKVRLPTSVPFMIAGIRMGIGRGLIGVVVGEFFGSREGLGYRVYISSQYFDTAALLGGVLIFAMAGVILVLIMQWVERRLAPWRQNQR